MKCPAFIADGKTVWLVRSEEALRYGYLSTYRRHLGQRVIFDADMVSWVIAEADWLHPQPWWKRLTASFTSGLEPLNVEVSEPLPYPLAELQERFLAALERDDDALTQHEDREAIAEKIQKARRFADLVWTWKWLTKSFRE